MNQSVRRIFAVLSALALLLALSSVGKAQTGAQDVYVITSQPISPRRLALGLKLGWTFNNKGELVWLSVSPRAAQRLSAEGMRVATVERVLPAGVNRVVYVEISEVPSQNATPLSVVLTQ